MKLKDIEEKLRYYLSKSGIKINNDEVLGLEILVSSSIQELLEELKEWIEENERVILLSRTESIRIVFKKALRDKIDSILKS